jgi:hypothetical protein
MVIVLLYQGFDPLDHGANVTLEHAKGSKNLIECFAPPVLLVPLQALG